MATTERYLAKNTPTGNFTDTAILDTSGGTATAYIELRMMQIKADGATYTKITTLDVIRALEHFKNYLVKGGKQMLGTTALPLPGPTS